MSNDFLDFIFASMVGIASYFFGGLDGLMQVLIILTIIDYISGFSVAGFEHVGVVHVIEKELFGGTKELLRDGVICFYLSNEGLSILENADTIGITIPEFIRKRLLQLKEKYNENDDTRAVA